MDRSFTDKVSGKSVDHPALQEMLAYVRDGDTIIVHSIDRLARNVDDLRQIVNSLTAKQVKVKFIKEKKKITTNTIVALLALVALMCILLFFKIDVISVIKREILFFSL